MVCKSSFHPQKEVNKCGSQVVMVNSLVIEAAETSGRFVSYLLRSQVINPFSSLENFNCLTHCLFPGTTQSDINAL